MKHITSAGRTRAYSCPTRAVLVPTRAVLVPYSHRFSAKLIFLFMKIMVLMKKHDFVLKKYIKTTCKHVKIMKTIQKKKTPKIASFA